MDNKEINKTLENLIEINKEAINNYRDASAKIKHPDLKTILYRLSQQRALFEAELKEDMRDMGGDPDIAGENLRGTLHEIWRNFKSGLHGDDTDAILNDCKKIESSAILAYEDALASGDLPGYIKDRVDEQYKLIKAAYDQLVEF